MPELHVLTDEEDPHHLTISFCGRRRAYLGAGAWSQLDDMMAATLPPGVNPRAIIHWSVDFGLVTIPMAAVKQWPRLLDAVATWLRSNPHGLTIMTLAMPEDVMTALRQRFPEARVDEVRVSEGVFLALAREAQGHQPRP
jgi:hypothetical protein